MTEPDPAASRATLLRLRGQLVGWLTNAAYPLWAANGIDAASGAFIETLGQDGVGLPHPRRARVHPRQIYAFAQAVRFGWNGDVAGILRRGVEYFGARYRRPDGLFRTLVGVDGRPLDERALLYDQAFALLGYAAAAAPLDDVTGFERRALDLRSAIQARLKSAGGVFRSDESGEGFIESNPHMHLLEACLAWAGTGRDPGWSLWVRELAHLALTRFIRGGEGGGAGGGDGRPGTGALGEAFDLDGLPAPGIAGRIVEPGHQFEWGWLLLRSAAHTSQPLRAAALRLIELGESAGVRNHVAVNALLDDLTVHDANARCWPQTERLKASLLAAQTTGGAAHWAAAADAATSLLPYLKTPLAGLWFDVQVPSGEVLEAPAPASTFYHLVGAIVALDEALPAD